MSLLIVWIWPRAVLLCFALSKTADRELKRQFREREPKKHYQAIVWGHLEKDYGEVNLPMICDWENRPRQRLDFILGKKSAHKIRSFRAFAQ